MNLIQSHRKMYLIYITFLYTITATTALDQGFELLFTSNPAEYTNMAVKFTGKLPSWLNGRLIKNGIGKMEMGQQSVTHAFDGYGKLTSFTFNGTNIGMFTSKFIHTKSYKQSVSEDNIAPFILLDQPSPPFNVFEKAMQMYNGLDNTNVNVHAFKSPTINKKYDYLAVSDFWQSYQFDPETLDTLSYVNPKLPSHYMFGNHVPLPSTSHPVKEYQSDSYISFVSYMSAFQFIPNKIDVIRIKSTTERDVIASLNFQKLPFMHSMGLSKNYAILFVDPLLINSWKLFNKMTGLDSLEWDPSINTKIYVINIHTGKFITVGIPPKVHMHHVNSYESHDKLIVDYIAYPDFSLFKKMLISTMFNKTARDSINPGCHLIRYKINLRTNFVKVITFTNKVKSKQFINKMDFPAINPHHHQRKYCYVYGVVVKSDDKNFGKMAMVKKDMCHKQDRIWYIDDHYATEPVFVPRPNGVREDDGVLLSIILNGRKRRSYLGVFDAKNLRMVAKGYLNDVIPFTLHGGFFNTDKNE